VRRDLDCVAACVRCRVEPEEKIAGGAPASEGDPALCPMIWPIVKQMAALAEALEVPQPVVARVMVKMRGGEGCPGKNLDASV
jgi:hypothetical protein